MASRRVAVIGMASTLKALDDFGKNMDGELKEIVKKTSEEVLDVAKKSVKRRSAGPRHGKRKASSVPGTPPNIQTGEYYNSMHVDNQGLYADVGTDDFRGRLFELGTQSMAARPHWVPALERKRFVWFKRLREVTKKAGIKTSRGKRAPGK